MKNGGEIMAYILEIEIALLDDTVYHHSISFSAFSRAYNARKNIKELLDGMMDYGIIARYEMTIYDNREEI